MLPTLNWVSLCSLRISPGIISDLLFCNIFHAQKIFTVFPDTGKMDILSSSENEQTDLLLFLKFSSYGWEPCWFLQRLGVDFLSPIKTQSWILFVTGKTFLSLAFKPVGEKLSFLKTDVLWKCSGINPMIKGLLLPYEGTRKSIV